MSDPNKKKVLSLLKEIGAGFLRRRKHNIYRLPNGKPFVIPNTPSDKRAWANSLAQLRRAVKAMNVDKTKLVKDASRTHIGPVPPTRVHKPSKHSEHPLLGQDADKGHFIHLSEPKEVVPHVPTSLSKHVAAPLERQEKKGAKPHSKVFVYSEEVIAHANFLLKSEGQKASSDYLRSVRQGMNEPVKAKPEYAGVKPEYDTTPVQPQPTPVAFNVPPSTGLTATGPLEIALEDAKKKVTFFTREKAKAEAEIARWTEAANQLESVLRTITGKAQPKGGSEMVTHRKDWRPVIDEAMLELNGKGTRTDIIHKILAKHPDRTKPGVYAAINTGLKNGWLREDDGWIIHTELEEGK